MMSQGMSDDVQQHHVVRCCLHSNKVLLVTGVLSYSACCALMLPEPRSRVKIHLASVNKHQLAR